MKKIYKLLLVIPVWFIFTGCSLFNKVQTPQVQKKDNTYYENVWKDAFTYNQTTATDLPLIWKYDFEFSAAVEWDWNKLKSVFKNYWVDKLKWDFSNMTIKLYWDYYFTWENKHISINVKLYYNKTNFGLWDVDMSFDINQSWLVEYYINNLDRNFLTFIWLDNQTIDSLIWLYEENKNKKLTYQLPKEIITQVLASLNESKDSPLYKNSKQQEQQIIEAFLKSNTIQVIWWSKVNDSTDQVEFKLNVDNLISFFNDVSKIIWENKSFDQEKQLLKDLTLKWTLNIANKLIVDSNILTEFVLKGINEQTKKEQFEVITLQSKLKILDPKIMDFDFLTALSSASQPENKLIIRLKWLIK